MAHVDPSRDRATLVTQPSKKPTRKVAAGAVSSVPLAVIIGWGASEAGIDLPEEVTLALAALLGSLGSQIVSYITRERA